MAVLSVQSDPTNPVSPAQHEASPWLGGLALLTTCLMVTALGGFFIVSMRNIDLSIIAILDAFYVAWAWRERGGHLDLHSFGRRTHGDLRVLGLLGPRSRRGIRAPGRDSLIGRMVR